MGEILKQLPREERVNQLLKETGTELKGHFIAASGKHLDTYIDKRLIYPDTEVTSEICGMFAEDFKDKNIEVVIAPAVGGIILSFETARQLTKMTGKKAYSIFLEKKKEGGFEIHGNLGKEKVYGKRALILDDILTTGGSLKEVVDETTKHGGNIAGVGVIRKRGDVTSKDIGVSDDVKIDALSTVKLPDWTEEECAVSGPCSKGIPVNPNLGRGKEYLAKKQTSDNP